MLLPLGRTAARNTVRTSGLRPAPPATVPDPFAFEPVTGAGLETLLTSHAVTITGIDTPATVTVSGGQYSIGCTASFTASPVSIQNNPAICVRHQSAAPYATQTITTPDPFEFEPQTGVLLSTQVTSPPVLITGIEAAADVTASNGSTSAGCTDAFTTGPALIENGESVCVRHVSTPTSTSTFGWW
jgi:hypothetical protein